MIELDYSIQKVGIELSKRENIIEATIKLISEKGVTNTTISKILEEASTGYGTLYNYFATKEDLFLEVYQEIVMRIDSYIFSDLNREMDADMVLQKAIRKYLEYCLQYQYEFGALEGLRTLPDICVRVKNNGISNIQLFEIIEACESNGSVIVRNPGYNMNLLLGIIATYIKYYRESGLETSDETKEDLVRSCFHALG